MATITVTLDDIESAKPALTHRKNLHPDELKQLLESSKKTDEEIKHIKSKSIKSFYRDQNETIDTLLSPLDRNEEEEESQDARVKFAVRLSMVANVLLFCMQLVGAVWSHSLSLISTTIDAFMDILSNGILLATDIVRRRHSPYSYPAGKSRMEPIGIIMFASMMSFMSLQIIWESGYALVQNEQRDIKVDLLPILLVVAAIGTKFCLYMYCKTLTSPTGAALAQDHRNDLVLNTFGIGMAILGTHIKWWIDPMGGLVIALLILRSWASTAYEQIELLVGKAAPNSVTRRLTYIAMNHDSEILKVDTCRAFYVGSNLFVELDIVLPEDMPLKKTHDIGESLQQKLESLPEVERAFVHADYECDHKASDEHKRPN